MTRKLATHGFIALTLAIALTATATHSKPCPEFSDYVPPDAETTRYPVYVALDCISGCYVLASVWIYQESNGIDGLQRDDDYCYSYGTMEYVEPDTVIF